MRKIRCQKCGKIFEFDGMPPKGCPECINLHNEKLELIRQEVKTNPGITPSALHEKTGLPITTILNCINSGHIEVREERPTLIMNKKKWS